MKNIYYDETILQINVQYNECGDERCGEEISHMIEYDKINKIWMAYISDNSLNLLNSYPHLIIHKESDGIYSSKKLSDILEPSLNSFDCPSYCNVNPRCVFHMNGDDFI